MRKLYLPMDSTSTLFGIGEDYSKSSLSLDQYLIEKPNSTFFFKMEGDSMFPYFTKGDLLIVDRSRQAKNGSIIIFPYEGELLCKVLKVFEKHHALQSINQKYSTLYLNKNETLEVWGVVIGQVRRI